jgi:hypothetical protein
MPWGKDYGYCINFPKILQLFHVLVENSSPKAGVSGANSFLRSKWGYGRLI